MPNILSVFVTLVAFAIAWPSCARAQDPHKLILQISDNESEKMNSVLNVAINVSRYFSEKAEEVDIQIIAFNAGLHMLRADTSPVKAETRQLFAEHAQCEICGLRKYARQHGKERRQEAPPR